MKTKVASLVLLLALTAPAVAHADLLPPDRPRPAPSAEPTPAPTPLEAPESSGCAARVSPPQIGVFALMMTVAWMAWSYGRKPRRA